MQKINLIVLIIILSTISSFGQYRINISTSYNIPSSSDFQEKFKNGYGVQGNISYAFNNSDFSASLLLGITSFRATTEYEKELKESNPTLFDYEYEIHYTTFPVMIGANYTFLKDKKLNINLGLNTGIQFMELKKKLIGDYVSDTHLDNFNEFAIYPSVGVSYMFKPNIGVTLKGGYNKTFGEVGLSYIDINLGLTYDI